MASPAKLRNLTIFVTIARSWNSRSRGRLHNNDSPFSWMLNYSTLHYRMIQHTSGVMGVRFDGVTTAEMMNVVLFLPSSMAVKQIWWEERQWRCLWQNRQRQWVATKSVVEGEELSHVSAGVRPHREWQQPMVNVIIRCERERGGGEREQVKQSSLEATFQSSEDFCSLKLFKNYFSI